MALATLVCLLLLHPAAAAAATFTVNGTADEPDAAENGTCLTAGGKCTLRAALEEANHTSATDNVAFEGSPFDGTAAGEIALNGSLPKIVNPVRIKAACIPAGGSLRPCVGIAGKSGEPALTIEKASGVQIDGLAIGGAQTGIAMAGAASFRIRTTWLGVKLDGTLDGDETGILVGPGSSGQFGSEGAGFGNVVAGSSGDGLHVEGASNVKVLGNYFGVEPDGTTAAANGKDVEITSTAGSQAVGNSIGVAVSAAAAATPACDGGCNVISGAGSNGIDLQGDGGAEEPALTTTVLGNYVGLDAGGSAAIPNGATGILVGEAAQTVIGGPKAGEANRINGGGTAVLAGPGAADLVVHGNGIGVDSTGTETLAPPGEGVVVDSEGLTSAAVEAAIVGNRIAMDDGVAISQEGFGARIADNEVDGGETAIEVSGPTEEHGNLIEGNSLEGPGSNGIFVESSFNEIVGNEVFGAGDAGILIEGSAPSGVRGNVVGGDAAADENLIVGSAGDAIEIADVESSDNEVARNRGIVNGGRFIDLVALSPGTEPKGPNHGIQPPAFATATAAGSSGSAEAGARVRVFLKQVPEAGELGSFLGEAIAGPSGEWEVAYGSSLPAGAIVAATQTSQLGGTSELSTATTAAESEGGGGGGGAGAGTAGGGAASSLSGDRLAPETAILAAPARRIHSSTARFGFGSDELGTTFQCRLDRKPFRACRSPKRYHGLKPGTHTFQVRAVDAAGNVDPSPAKRKFTVLEGGTR